MAKFSRADQLDLLKNQEFDLFVIGGGITGAGIARDAAMRGLKVAMVEARDFCSGSSSKSSKLLHGGIRYLEQIEFALVFEASQERRLHEESLSPHLAQSVPFLVPVYQWSPHRLFTVSFGVHLYDALALFRNHGTKTMSRDKTLMEEPRLESQGLKGGVVYRDVVMDDARIGLENVHSAVFHGAVAVNYVTVRGFDKDGTGRIRGVWLKDGNTQDFMVRAKCFVNATGPWVDYIRKLDRPDAIPQLRPTKGVHMVLPNEKLGKSHAFVLTAKSDDRVFFSIPWFDRTLIGTTDTDYQPDRDGPLHDLRATTNDIDYLMEGVKRTFPTADVNSSMIQSTFAGLRPLVAEEGATDPSSVSRDHRIWQEPSGLFNIAGGKYTTSRTMAAEMVNHAVKFLKKEFTNFGPVERKCATQSEPLVLPDTAKERKSFERILDDYGSALSPESVTHLQARYGARWQNVADLAMQRPELRERVIGTEPDIMAEIIYSRDEEMAASFEDVLRRRTMLALKAPLLANLDRVAKAAELFGEVAPSEEKVKRIQGLEKA